jgi:hypothetical protein
MPKRCPIIACGWRYAKCAIKFRGYRLLKYDDGHGELLNAQGEAEYYLRRKSVELLEAGYRK